MAKKKKKSSGIGVIVLLIFLLVGGLFVFNKISNDTNPVDTSDDTSIEIEIPQGASTKKIAEILEENGLIKSKRAFVNMAKDTGLASELKAGAFTLNKTMNVEEILNSLVVAHGSGKSVEKITIPEGFEIPQIASRIEEYGIGSSERFIELTSDKSVYEDKYGFLKEIPEGLSLEGYLYPATYDVNDNTTEEDLIDQMLKAFKYIYNTELKDNLSNVDMTLNEAVTLASIIEREGKLDSERPLMSSVFHNRIKAGIPLQSCASVQYILGERKPVLSKEDTKIDSPFNTYKNKGLPPSPIAASGKVSLISAVKPEESNYLFFVLTGTDGSHTFTETYEEHLKAKENMIRE